MVDPPETEGMVEVEAQPACPRNRQHRLECRLIIRVPRVELYGGEDHTSLFLEALELEIPPLWQRCRPLYFY